jgi:hypothetical protein
VLFADIWVDYWVGSHVCDPRVRAGMERWAVGPGCGQCGAYAHGVHQRGDGAGGWVAGHAAGHGDMHLLHLPLGMSDNGLGKCSWKKGGLLRSKLLR